MPKFSQRQRYTLAILCSLLIAGLVLLSFPAAEQDTATYSTPTGYSASALQTVIGYALSGYYASAHITTGNTATVTLTLVERDLVIFTSTFPAGTFDIPSTPITAANGGTVFLTITSQNQVFTQMKGVPKICHTTTTLPYFWAGSGILDFTGPLRLHICHHPPVAESPARKIRHA